MAKPSQYELPLGWRTKPDKKTETKEKHKLHESVITFIDDVQNIKFRIFFQHCLSMRMKE